MKHVKHNISIGRQPGLAPGRRECGRQASACRDNGGGRAAGGCAASGGKQLQAAAGLNSKRGAGPLRVSQRGRRGAGAEGSLDAGSTRPPAGEHLGLWAGDLRGVASLSWGTSMDDAAPALEMHAPTVPRLEPPASKDQPVPFMPCLRRGTPWAQASAALLRDLFDASHCTARDVNSQRV